MLLDSIFKPFVEKRPVAVMARATLGRVLDPDSIDRLFLENADAQYEYQIPFSDLVRLLAQVVLRKQPSVNAACQAAEHDIQASVTAVYRKLARTELPISEALVGHSFQEAAATVRAMRATEKSWLTGYTLRLLDGNHPAATEHRLTELRTTWDAPLPGKALVVYRPDVRLIEQVHLTDDGHAQERRLLDQVISTINARDLWVADRNFCTIGFLTAIHQRSGFFVIRQFVIRQHGSLKGTLIGKRRRCGTDNTGTVYEQRISINGRRHSNNSRRITNKNRRITINDDPDMPAVRRITVVLNEPTRDGETELHILSNVPTEDASAKELVSLYRKRWTIETVFADIARTLTGEIPSLCYPQTALLALCLSFVIYNAVSLLESAMCRVHSRKTVLGKVSPYYLCLEIQQASNGMDVAIPSEHWHAFRDMSPDEFGGVLRELAGEMNLRRYRKHSRGPKKPPPKRGKYTNGGHASTARLIGNKSR